MIPAETRYETHNVKLLAVIEAFKNWRHYLKGCQYEVLVLTDYNNLHWFMDTKSLSSRQVRWAQELSFYHFHVNYHQSNTNRAADGLTRYPQQRQGKREILQAENKKVLHHLQFLQTNARVFSTLFAHEASLKLVIICGTHAFPNICQFWETFC